MVLFEGVGAQAIAECFHGDDFGRGNVADVDMIAVMLEKPRLLFLLRGLEDEVLQADGVDDLIDILHLHVALGVEHADRAGFAPLDDDLPRPGVELCPGLGDALLNTELAVLERGFLADFGQDAQLVFPGLADQPHLGLVRHRHGAVRNLHAGES